jgi:BolA family transcriptional regulator, general stress-responsive regulator
MQNLIETLKQHLQENLHPTYLRIEDDSDMHAGHAGSQGRAHLTLHIVSAQFEGQSPVARHRLVYTALEGWMGSQIHALSIQAQTPLEYISTRSPK